MGLDPVQLKLHPRWLPFYRSGLRYLLKPGSGESGAPSEQGGGPRSSREAFLPRLERLSPPYSVLITYWDLCLDLLGLDRSEQGGQRRELFTRMLTGLDWPEQEYLFWPHSVCPDGEVVSDAELFWRGFWTAQPRYVLLFGERAARTVVSSRGPGSNRVELEGATCLVLPDPEEMLPDNRTAKNLVWRELKSLPVVSPS
jgi:hypothetical protein